MGCVALMLAWISAAGESSWLSVMAATNYLAALILGIGCSVVWIVYAPFPTQSVMTACTLTGLAFGLVFWSWDLMTAGFTATLILWTVFRTIWDLWVREDDIVSAKKPRAVWRRGEVRCPTTMS